MGIAAFEGTVEGGQIHLKHKVRLPEKSKVYVVVVDVDIEHVARVATPRLAHPDQASDFRMQVVEEPS